MPVLEQVSGIKDLREEKRLSHSSAVIKLSPGSSASHSHNHTPLSPARTTAPPGQGWNDNTDPPDFNQLKPGLCQLWRQFYADFSAQALHESEGTLSLNLPQF